MNASLVPDVLSFFMNNIRKYKILSSEEELALAIDFKETNNIDSAKKLVESNLRYVIKIANKFRRERFDFIDLIQEGYVGLMIAVKKFDPYRGVRLCIYASHWIEAYIRMFIESNWSMVKINTTQKNKSNFYKTSIDYDECVPEEIQEMIIRKEHIQSLNVNTFGYEDETYQDMLESPYPIASDVYEQCEHNMILNVKIENAINELSDRERKIIRERIMSDEPKTYLELSNECGVSRQRINEQEIIALKKLKEKLIDYEQELCYA